MDQRDQINDRREPDEKIVPLIERRRAEQPRQPAWIRRMNEGKLPSKDLTGSGWAA